jgi:hypothetical protein
MGGLQKTFDMYKTEPLHSLNLATICEGQCGCAPLTSRRGVVQTRFLLRGKTPRSASLQA